MFHKPFKVKTQTAIKGSDRKKLRGEIGEQFPALSADDLSALVPNKEDMTIMKISTHGGQNLLVYNLHGNPAFFQIETQVYPTVYTLWKHPDLMYNFTTWPPVFKKILGGADLMLPGVIVNGDAIPRNLGNLPKNHPCAVKLLGNRCPVAVGQTGLSSSDMYESAMRGKGVVILHCYQDQLWSHGDQSDPPLLEDSEMLEAVQRKEMGRNEEEEDITESTSSKDIVEKVENCDENNFEYGENVDGNAGTGLDGASAIVDGVDRLSIEDKEISEAEEADSRSPQEIMDELLYECFRRAIKHKVNKADLPLLTSTFYSKHLLPCCPRSQTLDIKKSSHKKLSKFLRKMQGEDFLKIKDQKGVESITEIYKGHPELRGVELFEDEGSESPEGAACGSEKRFAPPEVIEMFMVNGNTQDFFKPLGHTKGKAFSSSELREILRDYVKANELTGQEKKGFVTLDGPLSDLLLSKGENVESFRWDELLNRCQSKMGPAYQITFPGKQPALKKDKPDPVVINVVQRAGNKKVTLIDNLETYGIEPEEFGHTVQVGVACSTSVSPLPGKGKGMQLLIQGNQVNYVTDLLLEKYKLPRKWITGLDKAPKGKKKR